MTSTPEPGAPDPRLVAAHDLARAALFEITPAHTVGAPAGHALSDDGVVSLRFETTLPGYPGWFWTVSVAAVDDADPTVLEAELLPGDDALLAPDWIPWAQRLDEYKQAQAEAERAEHEHAGDDDEDDGYEDDSDDDDDDSYLHAGDVDGVDIDELDDHESDDDDDESDDDDDGDEQAGPDRA